MYGITSMTSKGQVTIPEAARKLLGALPGDKFLFDEIDPKTKKGTFKVVSRSVVDQTFGSLGSKKIPYVPLNIVRQKAGELLGKKYATKWKK